MSGNAVENKNAGHIFHVKWIFYPHVYAEKRVKAKQNIKKQNKAKRKKKKKNDFEMWNPLGNVQNRKDSSIRFCQKPL